MKHAYLAQMVMGILLMTGGVRLGLAQVPEKQKEEAMVTREYATPLNFLTSANAGLDKNYPYKRKTVREALESWGLPFPAGAEASFDLGRNRLVVRNTAENLEVVDFVVQERKAEAPVSVVCHLTVIEGPGKLMREMNAAAARKMNAVKELEVLLAKGSEEGSRVRVVGDAWLEARPGARARTETVHELRRADVVSLDEQGRAVPEMGTEMQPVGLRLELEAHAGAMSEEIRLTTALDLFPATPETRGMSVSHAKSGSAVEIPVTDVRHVHFESKLFLFNGDTKILGMAQPGGKAGGEDLVWMAFITTRGRAVESLPDSRAAAEKQPPIGKKATEVKQKTDTEEGEARDELDYFPARLMTSFFTLHTVQAPGPLLRVLAQKAAGEGDHAEMWREIEKAVARGEAFFVDSHALESKSGVKAEVQAAREWKHVASFLPDAKGRAEIEFETRPVGSLLSLEPEISDDLHSLRVEVDYELHTAPPAMRREMFHDATAKQLFEMSLPEFHTAHVVTGMTMASGGTRLLALGKPPGRGDADVLWASFLHGMVVRQQVWENRPPEKVKKTSPMPEENEWISRVYLVPPDFLSSGKTARQMLEEAGIPFPEGAKAEYNAKTNRLIVRNQRNHMELAEAFLGPCGLRSLPRSLVFTTHVIEGPGNLIRSAMREAAGRCDHRLQMDRLMAFGEVKQVGTSRIETTPGIKAMTVDALEHKALAELSMDEQGRMAVVQEMRQAGFMMTLEGNLTEDRSLVDVVATAEFHTSLPQELRETLVDPKGHRLEFPFTHYHAAKVTTTLLMPDGAAQLLGVWKPTGKPEFERSDILQAVFISCDVLPEVVPQK
ncbi:hypothetical protein [Prosthecobacter sp.]|uniref:hypothetical protein n=1 Tax=Prosthecobacter sp. TaxID=1965333 RepID=UPI003783B61B